MSLQSVRGDYIEEKAVLQAWMDRMDVQGTPEHKMSDTYKEGWKIYLNEVMKVSDRMIGMCDAGNATAVKGQLEKEADAYDRLAEYAQTEKLIELAKMLGHEANSRRLIVDEL